MKSGLIINSPYTEPSQHWKFVEEGQPLERAEGRRVAGYMVADPKAKPYQDRGIFVELPLVNQIRQRVDAWRDAHYPGLPALRKPCLNTGRTPINAIFRFSSARLRRLKR